MATIVTRSGKGSPLTNNEVDANFTNLNTDKAELSGAAFTGAITTTSTIDGRDVATDGTKLDGVEVSADVTDTANVTAAGALMDSELTSIASVKALNQGVATGDSPTFAAATITGEITANGGIALGDNDKATFGASDDLQIYHDGGNSYIKDVGTGSLKIQGVNLNLQSTSGESYIDCVNDGTVYVYHNNAAKLATTSTGIDVTGTATMDGLTVDGNGKFSGTTPIVRLTETDTTNLNTRLAHGGGYFFVSTENDAESANTPRISLNHATGDISFYEDTGTTPKLTWDASAELLTTTGLDVTGTATMDGLAITASTTSASLSSNDLIFTRDTYDAYIRQRGTNGSITITTKDGVGEKNRISIKGNGDISFYEDTGTTPKLFWDASAERLGIGTSSPQASLDVNGSYIRLDNGTYSVSMGQGNALISGQTPSDFVIGTNGSSDLVLATGEADRLHIDSSGRVGIGTSSPATGLDVTTTNYTYNGTNYDIYGIIGTTSGGVRLGGDSTNADSVIGTTGTGNMQFVTYNGSAWGSRMTLDNSGRVGIGTSSPSKLLHVKGSSDFLVDVNGSDSAVVFKESGGNSWRIGNDSSTDAFVVSQSEASLGTDVKLFIDSSGRVGIGTSSPSDKLELFTTDTNSGLNLVANNGSNQLSHSPKLKFNGEYQSNGPFIQGLNTGAVGYKALVFNTVRTGNDYTTLPAEAMRIDSSGNVGIGTASPSNKLEVYGGDLRVTDNYPAISLKDSDLISTYGEIGGGSGNLTLDSDLANNAANSYMKFGVDGSERMRIDSGGSLLIGQTVGAVYNQTSVTGLKLDGPNGNLQIARANNPTLLLNRYGNDGDLALFFKDGTGVGSIGTTSGHLYISGNGTNSAGLRLQNNGIISPTTNAVISGDTVDIGQAGAKFKDLYLSGAITAGGGISATPLVMSLATNNSNCDITMQSANTSSLTRLRNGTNDFQIHTNGSEAMRIDSSGNMLVGKTSQNLATEGISINPLGYIQVTENQSPTLYLNRLSTDGSIINFYKDGTTVGSIGSRLTNLYTTYTANGYGLTGTATTNGVIPSLNGGVSNGAVDLGGAAARFKDLYLSGGVHLGGTGAANKLDDYEEGTWSLTDQSGDGMSLSVYVSSYTKIGNQVFFELSVAFPTNSSSSAVRLSLPFTAVSSSDNTGGGSITVTNSGRNDSVVVLRGTSLFTLVTNLNQDVANSAYSGKQLRIAGQFTTA